MAPLWRRMPPSAAVRAAVTLGWAIALAAFFRYWEITLRLQGLMFWTVSFVALYLATAGTIQGAALRTPTHPAWKAAAVWIGVAGIGLIAHQLVPTVRLRGVVVPTIALVGALDVGFPLWIFCRALVETWPGWIRWLALGATPIYLLLLLWLFVIRTPGRAYDGPLPPLSDDQRALRDALERHVRVLSDSIGQRHEGSYRALQRASSYLSAQLAQMGYQVDTLAFQVGQRWYYDLEARVPGTRLAGESIVVGAHYDTVEDTPGADDNASGTAAVLELARQFIGARPARTIRFVLFPNEEPPFFATSHMGSWHYAARAADRGDRIVAMMALETIGYYSTQPGSQRYPFPFSFFYPHRGDFIAFVGNLASRGLMREAIDTFRQAVRFPSQGAAAPGLIPGVSWSDHQSFWLHGYRAIMISDTAPFRNRNYHQSGDTADTLDYDRMARVVSGLRAVIEHLAGS